jgi:hypothetical protein
MADAFRYFDKNYNNKVSFGEFQKALDNLRIKFQVSMIEEIFNSLDFGHKGYISYNDFCLLSEEKRRGIDAFDRKYLLKNEATEGDVFEQYLHGTSVVDLENMARGV